jgi:ADP-heptose:LPS heptosyltransferase
MAGAALPPGHVRSPDAAGSALALTRSLSDAVVRAFMRLVAWRLARGASLSVREDERQLPLAMQEASEILVVALAEAGDMVLLSPFLRELRRARRSARITLVCLPRNVTLFEHCGDVDEVIPFAATIHRMLRPFVLPHRARDFARRRLTRRFDVAIVPRWETDHYLATAVAVFSGAIRRVGHSEGVNPRKQVLNAGFDALYTDVVTSLGVAHEVQRHTELLRVLGATPTSDALSLSLTESDRGRAQDALAHLQDTAAIVARGGGAAHPKRRWPVARFAELGRALQQRFGAHIVVVGGPDDVAAQEAILRQLGAGATGLAGRLSLRETAAVLERCTLFVGNDSAPMHLAAAGKVACVEISCHPLHGNPLHYNAPERFGPWGVPAAVVRPPAAVAPCTDSCSAARQHCILEIAPDVVIAAAATLLERAVAIRVISSRSF